MKKKFRNKTERMSSFVVKANKLYESGEHVRSVDVLRQGLDYYSGRIAKAVSPYAVPDAGLLAASLRDFADEIERNNVGAKELSAEIRKCFKGPYVKQSTVYEKPTKYPE